MQLLKLGAFTFLICLTASSVRAQQSKNTTSQEPDVIRINTELIQAPVMVFDKSGKFVDGLQQDQFELRVDDHPQQLLFFEAITAGSINEAEKYERAQRGPSGTTKPKTPGSIGSVYGRTVIFFVDDLHLSQESVYRTRMALLHYIDSMGVNDRAMIATVSGQIGFLQQLTDNKDVLRTAVERLQYRQLLAPDDRRPPMTPYQAFSIQAGDTNVIRYFVDMAMADTWAKQLTQPASSGGANSIAQADAKAERVRNQAEAIVKNRAHGILEQHSLISAMTMNVLRNFVGSLTELTGSKLVFLISDGFFLNLEIPGELQKLNGIASGALKSGVVISSIQASGLMTTFNDASKEVRLSARGDTGAPALGQDTAMQAPMFTLASDTGGSVFFNSNDMDRSIRHGLAETARYYLVAWRPENNQQKIEDFRHLLVSIKGHPEWSVRMQKGYFAGPSEKASSVMGADITEVKNTPVNQPVNQDQAFEKMRAALSSLYPIRSIPIGTELTFLNTPQGEQLSIGTEVSVTGLIPEGEAPETGVLELAGIVLNDDGKTVSTFGGPLRFSRETNTHEYQSVSNVTVMKIKPGLYQVRVAARDQRSGLIGTTADWILVPDISSHRFALSSLVIGAAGATADQKARLNINHHFSRIARLRFLTYVYNATRGSDGSSAPSVSLQLRLLRDDQTISTSPAIPVATNGIDDLTRIPYAGELSLQTLPPGRYTLLVSATDNSAKVNATEKVRFVVEE